MKARMIEPKKDISTSLPAFYKAKDGRVVLFFTRETGSVINDSDGFIGVVSGGWISCYDTDVWTRLPNGTVFELIQD